jgi:hypothetical protein
VTLTLLAGGALLAGCGGGPRASTTQTVQGQGFVFQAPPSWTVARSSGAVWAGSGPFERVEVLRFGLEHPYRPALFAAAARELDRDIAQLAREERGRVSSGRTERLAGAAARAYRIAYGRGKTEEIAFVLSGDTEYELVCRRQGPEPDSACSELQSTFALASGG